MYLTDWYHHRGSHFILQRASSIFNRYGITSRKACLRIDALVSALAAQGCAPTFPSPGILAARNAPFLAHLQNAGAEIAVHGYQHLALSALPLDEAIQQLEKALRLFQRCGISISGFRCPYMSYTDELLDTLPRYFDYSSNSKFWWDGFSPDCAEVKSSFSTTLQSLYAASYSRETSVSVPWVRSHMVEIPVTLPDDLFLHDGLHLDSRGMAQSWAAMLGGIHLRGELFTLLFHTELSDTCIEAIGELLRIAKQLTPAVWIARLRDISDWWKEKSNFSAHLVEDAGRLQITFSCSDRATILAKGLDPIESGDSWDQAYTRLQGNTFAFSAVPRPFIGLPADSPPDVLAFLSDQGYLLETGERASLCGTYIDTHTLAHLTNQRQLIEHIEASSAPLIRFWRWPNGCKSALCITGDLDALSVMDYASRLPLLNRL